MWFHQSPTILKPQLSYKHKISDIHVHNKLQHKVGKEETDSDILAFSPPYSDKNPVNRDSELEDLSNMATHNYQLLDFTENFSCFV